MVNFEQTWMPRRAEPWHWALFITLGDVERPSQPLLVGCYAYSARPQSGLFFWSLSCVVVLRKQLAETPNFRPFASRHRLLNKLWERWPCLSDDDYPAFVAAAGRRIACLVPMKTVRFSGRCHVSHGRLFLYADRPRRSGMLLRCANRASRLVCTEKVC